MLYTVYVGQDLDNETDTESYETHDINRAFDIYDSEEHALIIGYRWQAGECIEKTIAEK